MEGVWDASRRRLTIGLVLTVTLVGFESLAISTVMPAVSDDLGDLGLYGWVYSAFFLATLVGAVTAGRLADRRGTAFPYVVGIVLFTAGLLVGGAAPSMPALVGARALQGLGAGAIPAVAYVSVGRHYPPVLRARVFAVFSTAWVLPGLAGPAAASAIEHAMSWRWVFWGLVPLVVVAAVLTTPALTGEVTAGADAARRADRGRVARSCVLAAGAALVLGAGQASSVGLAVALVVLGLPPAAWAFVRLVPEGTLRMAPGLPAPIALRGVLTFAFFGTNSFLPLVVTDVRGQSTGVAGFVLTVSTLTWTAAAWVQARRLEVDGPRRLARFGFLALAAGIAGALLLVAEGVPLAIGIAAWGLAGFGTGLTYSPLSVTVLGRAEPGAEGSASASLQLTDVLGVALGTGIVGALVELGEGQGWALSSTLRGGFALTLFVALAGVLLSARMPSTATASAPASTPVTGEPVAGS